MAVLLQTIKHFASFPLAPSACRAPVFLKAQKAPAHLAGRRR